jgi:hypothetical protein
MGQTFLERPGAAFGNAGRIGLNGIGEGKDDHELRLVPYRFSARLNCDNRPFQDLLRIGSAALQITLSNYLNGT